MNPATTTTRVALGLIDEPERPARQAIDPATLTELADSMAAEGLHQPIGLRRRANSTRLEIVWGHRRFLAAKLLQWPEIEAKLFEPDYDPLLARWSENGQREALTPVEEAHAVQQMLDRGHSRASVARLFRRSLGWVDTRLSLLSLPEDLRHAIHTGRLPLGVAGALAEIDHDDYRAELVAEAERTGATAATAAIWVAHYKSDRNRLLQNRATVQEFIEARGKYVVYYPCDACGEEVNYEQTRSFRFCASCTASLTQGLSQATTTPSSQPTA